MTCESSVMYLLGSLFGNYPYTQTHTKEEVYMVKRERCSYNWSWSHGLHFY